MTITIAFKCTSEFLISYHSVLQKLQIWFIVLIQDRFSPSQADVVSFKALKEAPDAAKYPHAARWYKHIASYSEEFATLPGDASKPYTTYGPEVTAATLNPAKAPAAEEDDEVDLFGSDDEEEDAEAERIRNERLAEYKKKKEGKVKPAAKSVVTMDIKPWGTFIYDSRTCEYIMLTAL
jgi:elongation factor 1-beta